MKYAQIGIIAKPDASPKQSDTDTVQYASLDHNAVVNPPSPDASVCLDQILIQLREVTPHWRRLGEAVGVHRLDEISRYVRQRCMENKNSVIVLFVCVSRLVVRVRQWWRWWMDGCSSTPTNPRGGR